MVGFMASHHLIARDAVRDGVHDRPLRGCRAPAALGFFKGEMDRFAAADVHVELIVLDEDAAPDDFAGFADAFEGAAAEAEVHGRLAFAGGAGPAALEMAGGSGAADFEDPDVFSGRAAAVDVAPAEVVERCF